jgi:hypothetical protein
LAAVFGGVFDCVQPHCGSVHHEVAVWILDLAIDAGFTLLFQQRPPSATTCWINFTTAAFVL